MNSYVERCDWLGSFLWQDIRPESPPAVVVDRLYYCINYLLEHNGNLSSYGLAAVFIPYQTIMASMYERNLIDVHHHFVFDSYRKGKSFELQSRVHILTFCSCR